MSSGYPAIARAAFSYALILKASPPVMDSRSASSWMRAAASSFARAIRPSLEAGYDVPDDQRRGATGPPGLSIRARMTSSAIADTSSSGSRR